LLSQTHFGAPPQAALGYDLIEKKLVLAKSRGLFPGHDQTIQITFLIKIKSGCAFLFFGVEKDVRQPISSELTEARVIEIQEDERPVRTHDGNKDGTSGLRVHIGLPIATRDADTPHLIMILGPDVNESQGNRGRSSRTSALGSGEVALGQIEWPFSPGQIHHGNPGRERIVMSAAIVSCEIAALWHNETE
jgi:hypothetical protein